MIVEVPVKGYFEENCFFYIDDRTKHGFVIDPGAQAGRLLDLIRERGWTIEKILLTHGHFDHTGAVDENVPGHTTDSVTFYSEGDHVDFVGDTIFKGSIGNYQYPGGNADDLQRSIIRHIFTLPDKTILCSGHSEQTTVGAEKRRYRY